MTQAYAGPLREEPLAIELHNTMYADAGLPVDGLADAANADAWLAGIATRLPLAEYPAGALPSRDELVELRGAVRAALGAVVRGERPGAEALAAINGASSRAPWSPVAVVDASGALVQRSSFHDATRADVVLAAFARDAIELVSGPRRHELRACGAPGCVLLFLKDHPRRAWCCNACGNRARQARHYRRVRG
jgi:predicted RNA-binding Zn ribbon-like protein